MDTSENAQGFPVMAREGLKRIAGEAISSPTTLDKDFNLLEKEISKPHFFKKQTRKKSKVLIIGAGWAGTTLASEILRDSKERFEIIGFIDDDPKKKVMVVDHNKVCSTHSRIRVVGNSEDLVSQVKIHNPHTIILAITHHKYTFLLEALNQCILLGYNVTTMPQFYEHAFNKIAVEHLEKTPFIMDFNLSPKNPISLFIFDLFIPLIAALILSPLFLFIAIAIKLNSKGPVFYLQERIGKGGNSFTLIKFRTMIEGADQCGPHWTIKEDRRITKVGKILRRFRLDELPQLFNVLKGDMALIGPRPEAKLLVEVFKKEIPFYECRHFTKAGVTGWAQVNYENTCSIEGALEKLRFDIFYLKHRSLNMDFLIFLKTLKVIFS